MTVMIDSIMTISVHIAANLSFVALNTVVLVATVARTMNHYKEMKRLAFGHSIAHVILVYGPYSFVFS